MSGSSKKPNTDPTFPTKNPTFGCRTAPNATTLLTVLTILRIPFSPPDAFRQLALTMSGVVQPSSGFFHVPGALA
jgi:hypothetical protein